MPAVHRKRVRKAVRKIEPGRMDTLAPPIIGVGNLPRELGRYRNDFSVDVVEQFDKRDCPGCGVAQRRVLRPMSPRKC